MKQLIRLAGILLIISGVTHVEVNFVPVEKEYKGDAKPLLLTLSQL
ncbi:MAG: hypothetical protein AB4372_29175 [Xenococcus sp. (in: cyanobacteria)]